MNFEMRHSQTPMNKIYREFHPSIEILYGCNIKIPVFTLL
jgi:hypothetical protein